MATLVDIHSCAGWTVFADENQHKCRIVSEVTYILASGSSMPRLYAVVNCLDDHKRINYFLADDGMNFLCERTVVGCTMMALDGHRIKQSPSKLPVKMRVLSLVDRYMHLSDGG